MGKPLNYARITMAAAQALADQGAADFAIYLPGPSGEAPLLYRDAGAGLSLPDFDKLRESGVPHLYVQSADLAKCEAVLEQKLAGLLASTHLLPVQKARLAHQVGTSVARDLTTKPIDESSLTRAAQINENVIGCILRDPAVAAHMLQMSAHEHTTATHMFVVSALAVMLGAEVYGADQEMLRNLGLAGMMHDLGKLSIDAAILNKKTPLTPDEMQLMHQHPVESVRLLGDDPRVTPAVRQIILQHHERVDGEGYPLGLSGDDLFSSSRILTIVDSFHAMVGRRPYKDPLTPPEANRVLQTQSGRQFDPDLLERWNALFERCWAQQSEDLPVSLTVSGPGPSVRHEHRARRPVKKTFGQRARRLTCNTTVKVRCIYVDRLPDATAAADEFDAKVYDVSRNGMCLHAQHPMYQGEVVDVLVARASRDGWVRAVVAWCRQHTTTSYRIGLKFEERMAKPDRNPPMPRLWETQLRRKPSVPTKIDPILTPDAPPRTDDPVEIIRARAMRQLDAVAAMRPMTADGERSTIALAGSPDALVRQRAVDVLAKIGTMPARKALLGLLKDEDPDVRGHAIGAAAALRMQESGYLLRMLLSDPEEGIALRAAGALGRVGDRDGLPLVRKHLTHEGPHTRLAAQVLGEIVGHRFAANAEGVKSARRYLEAQTLRAKT